MRPRCRRRTHRIGPRALIEVVVENGTPDDATVELHSRSADGSGIAELLVGRCEASWASTTLEPQWWITVNGTELIDEGSELPPAEPGESVVITVELNQDGAKVSEITVAPSHSTLDDRGNLCA